MFTDGLLHNSSPNALIEVNIVISSRADQVRQVRDDGVKKERKQDREPELKPILHVVIANKK